MSAATAAVRVPSTPKTLRTKPRSRKPLAGRVVLNVVLILGSVLMVMPFLWMILTSLKSPAELALATPNFLPQVWEWSNYPEAMKAAPFLTYFKNSFFIAIGHTSITLLLGSMAGYSLARLPFRGREAIFMGFLAMLMIPTYTKIVPQFLLVKFMPLFGGNDIGAGSVAYAAAKAAVVGLVRGLAKELAGDGVTVNAMAPGFIGATSFHNTFTAPEVQEAIIAGIPLKRAGTVDDVANVALFLASDLASYVTGQVIDINGGLNFR